MEVRTYVGTTRSLRGEGAVLQANQILGLAPGEVFVHRCVGNLATHKDMNAMTCLEYAVDALKVFLHVLPRSRSRSW